MIWLRTLSAARITSAVTTTSTTPPDPTRDRISMVCGTATFSVLTNARSARPGLAASRPHPANTVHASTIPVNPAARFWVATAIETISIPACANRPDTFSDRRPRSSRPACHPTIPSAASTNSAGRPAP